MLLKLRENPDLRNFVHQRLEPVVEHDRRRATKLLPTLQVLLDHQGRKAETARALHLERQSLYHRVQRIETLLDSPLDDPDTVLGLHLALRARRHLERIDA
ncbi:MAG: helix-turn-helix domain-containing protein [Solirubrobacterales bacterium]|nr:helix-turn-helix domain-containing protein [Solirubrobacterales bacterium]MBV9944526.1 helix-turn-helix domain-containing protein [Solirubrobacterales bacterium]